MIQSTLSSFRMTSIAPSVRPDAEETPETIVESEILELCRTIFSDGPVHVGQRLPDLDPSGQYLKQLFPAIEQNYGRKLCFDDIMSDPTVIGIARLVRRTSSTPRTIIDSIQPTGLKPSLFVMGSDASPRNEFRNLAYEMDIDQPVHGLKPLPPDGPSAPSDWIESTAGIYAEEIRNQQPEGPYHLLGCGVGCFLAFETAQQLRLQGETVGLLALQDSGPAPIRTLGFSAFATAFRLIMFLKNLRRRVQRRFPIEYALIPNRPIHFNLVYSRKRAKASYDQLVWDAHIRGTASYRCRPYDGQLTIVQTEDTADSAATNADDWSCFSKKRLVTHTIHNDTKHGTHLSFNQKLARILQQAMDQFSESAS